MTLTMNFIPMWKTKWILKTLDKSGIEATMGIFSYFPSNFCKTILSCYFLRSCFHSGLATHQKTQPGQFIILSKRESLSQKLGVWMLRWLQSWSCQLFWSLKKAAIHPSFPLRRAPTLPLTGCGEQRTALLFTPGQQTGAQASPTKLQSLLTTTFTK